MEQLNFLNSYSKMLFRSAVEFPSRFYFPHWVQVPNKHNNVWPQEFPFLLQAEGEKKVDANKNKRFPLTSGRSVPTGVVDFLSCRLGLTLL